MIRRLICTIAFVYAASIGSTLTAQTVLTAVSLVDQTTKSLTLEQLVEVGEVEITTSNEFVDGERVFRGPLLRDVLTLCKAVDVTMVRLTAANDYQVEIDAEEFQTYDAILALSMDGVPLSKRDKGPIWMIYPMSDHEELRDPVYNSSLIWQVVKLEYK